MIVDCWESEAFVEWLEESSSLTRLSSLMTLVALERNLFRKSDLVALISMLDWCPENSVAEVVDGKVAGTVDAVGNVVDAVGKMEKILNIVNCCIAFELSCLDDTFLFHSKEKSIDRLINNDNRNKDSPQQWILEQKIS